MAGTIEELIGTERMKGISPFIQPKGNEVIYPTEQPSQLPTSEIVPSGGLVMGATSFPTSIGEWWERSLLTPTLSPIGLVKAPMKTIIKYGGVGLGAIGGFILASLFGGGQEQQQEITQAPDVDATQDTPVSVNPLMELLNKIFTAQTQKGGGGDIDIIGDTTGGVGNVYQYEISQPYTYTYSPQTTTTITKPTQITKTVSIAGQEAKQEQGIGLLEIAILGGAILGGAYLFGGKRT